MADAGKNYKIILLALLALLSIHAAICLLWHRDSTVAASQWGANKIRTERFLFSDTSSDCVLVGSSMSAVLEETVDGKPYGKPDIVNLAYAGGSPLTGLQLIALSEKTPACLLIESNLAYKDSDVDQLALVNNKALWLAKRFIINLRHENQPLNLLLTFLKTLRNPPVDKQHDNIGGQALNRRSGEDYNRVKPLIADRVSSMARLSEQMIAEGAERLVELAEQLEARGTEVIFFEMPGEQEVRDSVYYQRLRTILREELANSAKLSSSAATLNIVEIEVSTTTDGVHLGKQSTVLATEAMFNLIAK
ncbi:MAG: hypothetical protein AB8B63_00235 [Granulosicoccus sp.]